MTACTCAAGRVSGFVRTARSFRFGSGRTKEGNKAIQPPQQDTQGRLPGKSDPSPLLVSDTTDATVDVPNALMQTGSISPSMSKTEKTRRAAVIGHLRNQTDENHSQKRVDNSNDS